MRRLPVSIDNAVFCIPQGGEDGVQIVQVIGLGPPEDSTDYDTEGSWKRQVKDGRLSLTG